MKKIFFGVIMAMSLAGSVFAADVVVQIDGKNIQVTDISKGGDDRPIHSKDLRKGIFVRVFNHSLWNGNFPGADAIVRKQFADSGLKGGFKVVEKAEDADVAITFAVNGKIDLVAANNKAEHSNILTTGSTVGKITAVAAGLAMGPAGAIGAVVGAFIPMDDKSSLQGFVSEKPSALGGNFVMSSVKGSDYTNGVILKYNLEKGNEATDDILLKELVNEWIKLYMIHDAATSQAEVVPATTVSAADPVAK